MSFVAIGTIVALSALLAGCGRSPLRGGGEQTCAPSCDELCAATTLPGCAAFPSCLALCLADARPPTILCLEQLTCATAAITCGAITQCLKNPRVADLVVSSFSASSVRDDELSWQAQVCNFGNGASTATRLHFYRNRDSAPRSGELGDESVALPALAAQSCETVLTGATGLPNGTYRSYAYVDAEGLVVESNEQNNGAGPKVVQVGGLVERPDYVITGLQGVPNISVGHIDYTVTVCNYARSSPQTLLVDLYVNRSSAPPESAAGDITLYVEALDQKKCAQVPAHVLAGGLNATVTSWARVDRLQHVAESNEQNNLFGPVSIKLGKPQPDLQVSKAMVQALGGTTAQYTATVCNTGGVTSTPTDLGLYWDHKQPPQSNEWPDQVTSVPTLGSGQCVTRTLTAVLEPGSYRSALYVDRKSVVVESDEGNNAFWPLDINLGMAPVDLELSKLQVFPQGTTGASYLATICNKGTTATTSSTTVEFFDNRQQAPGMFTPADRWEMLGVLGGGQCTDVKVFAPLPAGSYSAWAYVNRKLTVAETTQGNNLAGPVKFKLGSTTLPDLVVTSMIASSQPGGMLFDVNVCNYGVDTLTSATLDLYWDESGPPLPTAAPDQTLSVPVLKTLQCAQVQTSTPRPPGAFVAWAWVNRGGTIVESNSGNNQQAVKYVVPGGQPDLTIKTFGAKASLTGPTLYTIEVCNDGSSSAAATTVRLYLHRTTAPPLHSAGDQEHAVGALTAGSCQTISALATLQPGTYSSWAQVDATNAQAESDETNNVAGPLAVTLGTPADACQQACKALVDPCFLVPSAQEAACVTNCEASSQAKIDCAWQATVLGQCMNIVQCIFGP